LVLVSMTETELVPELGERASSKFFYGSEVCGDLRVDDGINRQQIAFSMCYFRNTGWLRTQEGLALREAKPKWQRERATQTES
jgi:hypothetical protein